jgi:hypothetical protein
LRTAYFSQDFANADFKTGSADMLLMMLARAKGSEQSQGGGTTQTIEPKEKGRSIGLGLLIVTCYLLLAHGCHATEDNELGVLPERQEWQQRTSPSRALVTEDP